MENEEASVVLVGSLNPAIFHPEWLLRHGLISKDDLDGAKVDIVHNDITKFSLEWLKFDVTRNKIYARTNDPSKYTPLKDLMISILKILEHIPIIQMGMNRTFLYKIDTEELWHKIGDNLAPKKYWDFLPHRVGLLSINVGCPRPDTLKGGINIGIKSTKSDFCGVHFNVNSHVETQYLDGEKEIIKDTASILFEHWDVSLTFAQQSCENVLKKALEL
ncbi:hypothetical protein [Desulfobacterium sp. N47]|uniref:Uncharacterized protein n=1 Tax=uncultured Desulfobacterium sp. TaxID=201089 RepID=E1Y862_9BACT|nr:hypothetical protein N47_A07850 [uncultured Desulfobacterium sp.]